MVTQKFAIIGGDKRNIALAENILNQGYNLKLFGFTNYDNEAINEKLSKSICETIEEVISDANYIIGGIPCSYNADKLNAPFHNGILYANDLFKLIKPHQIFVAGYIKPEILVLAQQHSVHTIDLLQREELLLYNAIPTAEGALKIAIEETDITIHDSKTMVIGYGRIGTILCRILASMGSKVTAVIDTPSKAALATSAGHKTAHFATEMNNQLHKTDIIFNTVPQILLNESNMHLIRKNTLIIDLASAPYGVDSAIGRRLGLKVLLANSLPGKIAPVSAASYIFETLLKILEEEATKSCLH